jgi:hypothetical protein
VFRNRPVSLALVGLFVWVTACSTYTQIELQDVGNHGKVRVTTTDGDRIDYYHPRVETDSIKGRAGADSDLVYAIPLERVVVIEEGGSAPGKTIGLVVGIIFGAGVLAFLGYWAGCSASDTCLAIGR